MSLISKIFSIEKTLITLRKQLVAVRLKACGFIGHKIMKLSFIFTYYFCLKLWFLKMGGRCIRIKLRVKIKVFVADVKLYW